MTPQDLIAAFDTLAEAPNAGDRLRELVLQLAVRGKLVQQGGGDECASDLLERISTERSRLISVGKARRQVEVPAIADPPYAIPDSWMWTCTAGLGIVSPRYTAEDDAETAFVPMPVIPTDFRGSLEPESRPWKEIKKGYTHVGDGDVAVAKITPCFQNRKSCVMTGLPGGIGAGTTELHVISPIAGLIEPKYLLTFYKTPDFIAGGVAEFTGTAGQQRVPRDYFMFAPLPLPPLPEQRRIVARVDELMGLLDRLEAARDARETTRKALRDSALAALQLADTPEEVETAWQRFGENIDDLFTNPADIESLRQTVLQLAVRGRLVPQNPNDEPVGTALSRIAEKKNELVGQKKIRKPKGVQPLEDGSVPYVLPTGWKWARFADVAYIASNLVKPADHLTSPHVAPDNIEKATGQLLEFRSIAEDGVTSNKHQFYSGQILYSKIRPNLSKVVRVDFDGLCSADMYPIESWILREYLFLFMLSPPFLTQVVSDENRLAMPKVNQQQLYSVTVAVPPMEEQHRIVERTVALLDTCVRLKDQLASSALLHDAFAAAAVHHLDA